MFFQKDKTKPHPRGTYQYTPSKANKEASLRLSITSFAQYAATTAKCIMHCLKPPRYP
jgi:hypothetical protein